MTVRWLKSGARVLFGQERITSFRDWLYRTGEKTRLLRHGICYRSILPYLDIDGWMSISEATTLYDLARALPASAPVVVEIGSWLGKSSLILAKGIFAQKSPVLYCIDPFDGAGDPVSLAGYSRRKKGMQTSLRDKFDQNMHKNKVSHILKVCQGFSHDFVAGFDKRIDFLFIDGNHEYQSVLQDYHDWSPFVKAGGLIAFHDVVRKVSVRGPFMVVEQECMNNPQWKFVCWIGSLYVAQKLG